MPTSERSLLPTKGGNPLKHKSLLEYLPKVGELQHLSNLKQTHSDKLPLPGHSIEDVQLAVALTLPQATINKD